MVKLPDRYIVYGEPIIRFNDPNGYYVVIYSVDTYPGLTDGQRNVPFYLHSDGEWRVSTIFNGAFTGYYETKEAAELALKSAISDNND